MTIVPPDTDIAEVEPGWHWYLDRLAAALAASHAGLGAVLFNTELYL
jgi:hypothetical protein